MHDDDGLVDHVVINTITDSNAFVFHRDANVDDIAILRDDIFFFLYVFEIVYLYSSKTLAT